MRYLTKLSLALTFVASVYSSTALSQVKDKYGVVGLEVILLSNNPLSRAAELVVLTKGPEQFYDAEQCYVPGVGLQMQLEQDLERVNALLSESERRLSPELQIIEGNPATLPLIKDLYANDRRSDSDLKRFFQSVLSLQQRGDYSEAERLLGGRYIPSLEGLDGLSLTKERGRELDEMNRNMGRVMKEVERVRSKVEGRLRGKVK